MKAASAWWLAGFTALIASVLTLLVLQRNETAILRLEVRAAGQELIELRQLKEQRERLLRDQVSGSELEQLRAESTELERLRADIVASRQSAATAAKPNRILAPRAADAASTTATLDVMNEIVPVGTLINAGRDTAAAAVQTALWAAAGGDVEQLAETLFLDPRARSKAQDLLASLSEEARAEYGTPERLVALFTAKDVPMGGARIIDFKRSDASGARLVAQVMDASGKTRAVGLSVRQIGDIWKIAVPVAAVEKYAQLLKGAPAPPSK
ncbi:MAG: hypothetical protein Q7S40_24275 [Opitutaceae bacterium]|nr:hypothetical protein [Opitutaceae bacterium]